MSRLNVELYGVMLGTLSQTALGVDFQVNPEAFSKFPLLSTIMSLAVPLNLKFTNPQKRRCSNFFVELLPEGRNLRWLEQSLPRDERNLYGMLRKYGKDIAGALIIYDPNEPEAGRKPKSEQVDPRKIRYLFEHMPQEPLGNSPVSGKTSLGGVQGKIVLAKKGQYWYRTHYGYPSTHILKPVVPEYPTMIYDEAFCMQAAAKAGLTGHPVWIEEFDGAEALVIERFDRNKNVPLGRIHQEDFNQVLGAHGNQKYQEYGGKVSAKRIAQTLESTTGSAGVKGFASQLIFAIAIGNLDMHAKNVSVLHLPDETVALAPAYDQVPLRHHNTDVRLALAVGGEYTHSNITLADIASELTSWKCQLFSDEAAIDDFIKNCLTSFQDALDGTKPGDKAYPRLKKDISLFISNLLAGDRIGAVTR